MHQLRRGVGNRGEKTNFSRSRPFNLVPRVFMASGKSSRRRPGGQGCTPSLQIALWSNKKIACKRLTGIVLFRATILLNFKALVTIVLKFPHSNRSCKHRNSYSLFCLWATKCFYFSPESIFFSFNQFVLIGLFVKRYFLHFNEFVYDLHFWIVFPQATNWIISSIFLSS